MQYIITYAGEQERVFYPFKDVSYERVARAGKKTQNTILSVKIRTSIVLAHFSLQIFPRQFRGNGRENNQIIGKMVTDAIWFSQMGLFCRSCTLQLLSLSSFTEEFKVDKDTEAIILKSSHSAQGFSHTVPININGHHTAKSPDALMKIYP